MVVQGIQDSILFSLAKQQRKLESLAPEENSAGENGDKHIISNE